MKNNWPLDIFARYIRLNPIVELKSTHPVPFVLHKNKNSRG